MKRQVAQVTPAEMEKRITRLRTLRPQSQIYERQGIPTAAYEMVAAKALFTLMAPSSKAGPMSAAPPIIADDNLSVVIAECPPGNKPLSRLHQHLRRYRPLAGADHRQRHRELQRPDYQQHREWLRQRGGQL